MLNIETELVLPEVFLPQKNLRPLTSDEISIVERFHDLYYRLWQEGRGTIDLSYMGVCTYKCPMDLWIYQEILFELRPDLIIESGTRLGGSAYYLAHLCRLLGHGKVISIDIDGDVPRPKDPLIQYITGSSVDLEIFKKAELEAEKVQKVLVILDSDHSQAHVAREIDLYKNLVTPGSYLIVEDTNIHGHPTFLEHGPGPMEAVNEFIKENQEFEIDLSRERMLMTLNPRGYLKKKVLASGQGLQ
jgi:cephalosporin hydroxylase